MLHWPVPDDDIYGSNSEITRQLGTKLTRNDCWQLAYQVALKGAGRVRDNPLVGAVAIDDAVIDVQRRPVPNGPPFFAPRVRASTSQSHP